MNASVLALGFAALSLALLVALAVVWRRAVQMTGTLQTRLAVAEERAGRALKAEAERKELEERLERVREDRSRLEAALADHREALARKAEALEQVTRQDEEKRALLAQAQERLSERFKLLADEVLGQHGQAFKVQNKEQLDALLKPLKEQLFLFQEGLRKTHLETTRDRAGLAEQLRLLALNNQAASEETRALTRALKGDVQSQGAWGEMVLATLLERSGLREGEEYTSQESHVTEEGGRLRPDVVIRLPEGRRTVVDSKVSLSAFTDFVNESDPALRDAHLARHVASLRAHVKGLSAKGYEGIDRSGLDFVLLFVPMEGALAAAMRADAGLATFALEHNVGLCTPTTLMIALRTIANVWQVERRNQNAELIADRAGKLYDKFVGFVADLKALETQLDRTRATYAQALGKLTTGSGNLVRQVEMLRRLGAKTGKTLDPELVELAGADDDEIVQSTA